jgi:hypothetical protein
MNDSDGHDQTVADGENDPPKKINRAVGVRKVGKLLAERWPEYLLEIIVVIIGITISFAINNYQVSATNRSLEQTYLQGLLADISSDIIELQEVIVKTRAVVESCQVLIEHSRSDKATLTADKFIAHVMGVGQRPSYVSKNATFAGLKNSGNFNLISDNGLKLLLFEHDAQYQVIKTLENAELQVVVGITGPYILKYIPIDDPAKANAQIMNKLNVQSILGDVEFINNVILRADNRQELLATYEETLVIAKKIHGALEKNVR